VKNIHYVIIIILTCFRKIKWNFFIYKRKNALMRKIYNYHAGEGTVLPEYELVGPFMYQRFVKKVNVSFTDNGDHVYYAQFIYYIFDEEQSLGQPDDPTFLVTNINQAYMGVLAQVGSEQKLVVALTGPTLAQLFTLIGQPFGYTCCTGGSYNSEKSSILTWVVPPSQFYHSSGYYFSCPALSANAGVARYSSKGECFSRRSIPGGCYFLHLVK